MLCRTTTSEPLVCPANSKRKDAAAGYNTLALHLSQLQELDENPFAFDVSELDSGDGIESTLSNNNACWHKSCRNKINSTEISLRSKRFGKAFRTFDALFAFLAAEKLGRVQKSA